MKKWLFILIPVLLGFVLLSAAHTVRLNYTVQSGWMQLEGDYQRRADLIPNLAVLTAASAGTNAGVAERMAGYRLAAIESQRLAAARAPGRIAAVKARVNTRLVLGPEHFLHDQNRFGTYIRVQNGISRLAERLIVSETGPAGDHSIIHIMELMQRMEERIRTNEQHYNTRAQRYNASVSSFPGRLYAGIFRMYPVITIGEQHEQDAGQADTDEQLRQ
ncbi:MAG: hypothetical protein EA364_13555 [Balneolaceae bacterium]|nr:MAG: hypothetical protein EA364_13555 [Balneolaceae bacterium]